MDAGEPDASVVRSDGGPITMRSIKAYVSGESIERRNRYVTAPFTPGGGLNQRGGGDLANDNDEYGWMVPLADRLHIRDQYLKLDFIGTDGWLDADDAPYNGTYPSNQPGKTSAISGTDILTWLDGGATTPARRSELTSKKYCYDIAFAARGGNDYANDDDAAFKAQLKELIGLLAAGSSCRTQPIVYVTGHMPDDRREGESNAEFVAKQRHRYVERVAAAVNELTTAQPSLRVRFVDLFTPFIENKHTNAFAAETWFSEGLPDFAKMMRDGDGYHPRRMASIYAGENAADALDLAELHALVD